MQFTEAVVNLKFDEEPKYSAYVALFEPLCGPAGPARPILTEGAPKVGQKRNRESLEDETLEIVSVSPFYMTFVRKYTTKTLACVTSRR